MYGSVYASFAKHLIDLVNEGEVSIDRVNDAVRRILKFKHELGLFEQQIHIMTTTKILVQINTYQ